MRQKISKLVLALHRVVGAITGATFKKSGNILKKLRVLGEEAAIVLADSYYNRIAKEKEVFEKGYLLGRLNKTKKPVYRIEYPPHIFYFIGTEADILRKFTEYVEEKESTPDEAKKEKTDKTDSTKGKMDFEITDKELSRVF